MQFAYYPGFYSFFLILWYKYYKTERHKILVTKNLQQITHQYFEILMWSRRLVVSENFMGPSLTI